jgi:hypothetical protein
MAPTPSVRLTAPHALVAVANATTGADMLYIVSDSNVIHVLDTNAGTIVFKWSCCLLLEECGAVVAALVGDRAGVTRVWQRQSFERLHTLNSVFIRVHRIPILTPTLHC